MVSVLPIMRFDFDAPSAGTAGPYGDLALPPHLQPSRVAASAPADPTAAVPIPATSTPSPAGTVQGRSLPVRFAMAGLVLVLLTTLGFAYKPVGMPGATTSGGGDDGGHLVEPRVESSVRVREVFGGHIDRVPMAGKKGVRVSVRVQLLGP